MRGWIPGAAEALAMIWSRDWRLRMGVRRAEGAPSWARALLVRFAAVRVVALRRAVVLTAGFAFAAVEVLLRAVLVIVARCEAPVPGLAGDVLSLRRFAVAALLPALALPALAWRFAIRFPPLL